MNNIILASSSPRRRELLEKYHVGHKVVESKIIEKINFKDRPEQIAMTLAFNKAYYVSKGYKEDIVIGADTIVVFNNQILGKPKDELDAARILRLLSDREHVVITGISLINLDKNIKIIDFEKTLVKFRKLDKNSINRYINTKEPFDKAGAYGIQGYGALLVERINGCYNNVVGLPLVKLDHLLNKHFDISIL